ncbi:DEAD/DEAH box helicase [Cryobacterium sp. CG_9.6]|uniref:DEAD/DEAH box helicase n=1 Tax=Cryobacterium sp. CG_9.6 TaxID=2760710 RepID=UPI0024761D6A|nr:DEAD/DEAH box helicase [Cryobacterium sp. CG_9.6]MDH6236334.1 superfamily II DNA or RNA helicase/HKD family nuclease [Cryobacterium sp. CG_9.6]
MSSTSRQLTLDNNFGFLDSHVKADQVFHPTLVSNTDGNTMLRAIREELKRSRRFVFSVAFITPSAVAMLKQAFLDFRGSGTIITSTYLGFNSPAAFRELLNLDDIDVYVHPDSDVGFHAKGYIFEQVESTTAIVGSSNLTERALLRNHEWNLRFSALPDGDIVQQLNLAAQAHIDASVPLTRAWIDEYELTWSVQPRQSSPDSKPTLSMVDLPPSGLILPNVVQIEALGEIAALRESGETRAVVISATGTGKTILSALDVRAYAPKRMLFVVHREQILDRAIAEFKRVLNAPESDFGKFVGAKKELDRRYVFASIQSLSRPENLAAIETDAFDYVLIDEVHRAGAASYRRVIDYLKPAFLLGMTATPERTDDFNVFELFGYNVPYEIRLQKALEADMLAPFHYYGVTDFTKNDGEVIDQLSDLSRLVASERVDHLVSTIEKYGHAGVPVRGLIFCSRNAEAAELAEILNSRTVHGKRLRTQALSGEDSVEERESAVQMLERGDLDYLATVDIFNEGIDIPSVNQVIMLRQTLSSIVFTQQLGRGLRKAAGKDHLVVIDFIGNYDNNYLIPIALFGDSTLNKDSIRKKIIDAQEAGAIAGLSSVNFDAISRERIFASLATTKLDSMTNLKKAFLELKNRLGHAPRLIDFARFDLVDPTVIATKHRNYWRFLEKVGALELPAGAYEDSVLSFLSEELLNGKRPHELLLLDALLSGRGPVTERNASDTFSDNGVAHDPETLASVIGILSLTFFTDAEAAKYGSTPIISLQDGVYELGEKFATAWKTGSRFQEHVRDVIDTGLYVARHRYNWAGKLEVGQRYSRKDVCRLLNWKSNEQSTMYGYKVDYFSNSCPIFVTYHKGSDVSESTKYEDEFLNPSTLTWFTRSRRTLASLEVKAIVENSLPLHVFAKKDDAEGTGFYYLGQAKSQDARETKMAGSPGSTEKKLDVVSMRLDLASPIESSLYDYFSARASGV